MNDVKRRFLGRLISDILTSLTLGVIIGLWPGMRKELFRLVLFLDSLPWNFYTPLTFLLVGWMFVALGKAIKNAKAIITIRLREEVNHK